jgi:quinone-modifying oxidoreductase, subunit QmoC
VAQAAIPDREFLNDIVANGGGSVKKCFQCANCAAVCKLSTGDAPFPRKQMHMAGWGMKNKLMADPTVFYCHQCKDCSTQCPRNAQPAETLAAVRLSLIKEFSVPSFFGKMMNDPKMAYLPFAIGAVFIGILVILGKLVGGHHEINPNVIHTVHYGAMLPHWTLEIIFSLAFFLGIGGAAAGGLKFWKAIDKSHPGDGSKGLALIPALIATAIELVSHNRFGKCGEDKTFKLWHMAIFYGFMGLMVVTGIVVIFAILGMYPLNSILHPLKIAGNLAGVALIVGCAGAIYRRMNAPETDGKGAYGDWLLLFILLGVGVTGMTTQAFRLFIDTPGLAYPSYFIHMVFNFVLLVFLPYTKFAHLFYRFLALTHARMRGLDIQPAD